MVSKLCTIYVVRHGETEFNVKKFIQGQIDSPLTEIGIQQANALAQKLKTVHFDAVFSSDLLRAKRTAELIAFEHDLAVVAKEALRERSFGQFEGQHYSAVRALDEQAAEILTQLTPHERLKHSLHPDIETDDSMVGRFITFVREIALTHPGQTLLMVSHGGMMRALLIHLGFNNGEVGYDVVKNTSYIKLRTDGVEFDLAETFGIEVPEKFS